MNTYRITTLFLDIGGVLLTNGWDRTARRLASEQFHLDFDEMNERHHLIFDVYEMGKITLNEYLDQLIFDPNINFSKDDFKSFMFQQSQPYYDTIDFFKELKRKYSLKVVAVNNEGRELNEFRIKKFHLDELFDGFVSSSYVKMRKPDIDIFRLACDISKCLPQQALLVDDRDMFVEVAKTIGINGIHYEGLSSIKEKMSLMEFDVNNENTTA
jgi:putative hydrolase of the HAD superfamily